MKIDCINCKLIIEYDEKDVKNPSCGSCTKVWRETSYIKCPYCECYTIVQNNVQEKPE